MGILEVPVVVAKGVVVDVFGVVVVVDTIGLLVIVERIVSVGVVEVVGVGVVRLVDAGVVKVVGDGFGVGVPMVVTTGGWEASFLGTHLPDLQDY